METEEFSLFSGGLHQQATPSFSKDDQEVYFYADSLVSGDFGLWKRDFSGNSTPIFTSFDDGVNLFTNMPVFRGLDVSRINEMVVADHLQMPWSRRPVRRAGLSCPGSFVQLMS